jgi:methyl-accepting chemotaxis protein
MAGPPRSLRITGDAPRGDLLLVIVVLIVLVVAAGLLNVVAAKARSINGHAADIAANTRGINEDTGAIRLLDQTNQLAASILDSARPLEEELANTVELAQDVDGRVTSINRSAQSINGSVDGINTAAASILTDANDIVGTARAINGSAESIQGSAATINQEVAAILDVARRINVDVRNINLNLNDTIEIVNGIRGDTRNLVVQGRIAHKEAACIDREVNTRARSEDGDCEELRR